MIQTVDKLSTIEKSKQKSPHWGQTYNTEKIGGINYLVIPNIIIKSCCTKIIIICFKVTYKYSYFTLLNRMSKITQSKK